jgi:hypothetical protein
MFVHTTRVDPTIQTMDSLDGEWGIKLEVVSVSQ